jgi:hypothetical protein
MLFDLRGAGRRTTIKIVYLSLAVLMGGGLVLFGIGGDVSGGLFDAFGERNATTDTGKGRYENRVEAAQRETRIDPDNPVTYADTSWATRATTSTSRPASTRRRASGSSRSRPRRGSAIWRSSRSRPTTAWRA